MWPRGRAVVLLQRLPRRLFRKQASGGGRRLRLSELYLLQDPTAVASRKKSTEEKNTSVRECVCRKGTLTNICKGVETALACGSPAQSGPSGLPSGPAKTGTSCGRDDERTRYLFVAFFYYYYFPRTSEKTESAFPRRFPRAACGSPVVYIIVQVTAVMHD